MPNEPRQGLPHLYVRTPALTQPYTYPRRVGGTDPFKLPPRVRVEHAERLLSVLGRVSESLDDLRERRRAVGIAENLGLYLEFESDPSFELALKSLDRGDTKPPIELVAVRERGQAMVATVFVPEGKLENLESLVKKYRDEDTKKGRARNQQLVESIAKIRRAVVESLWTDDAELFPDTKERAWWEVWLRVGQDRDQITSRFKSYAEEVGIRIQDRRIEFEDRTVLLALATRERMSQSVELLDCIAELRLAKDNPEFYMELRPHEQVEWIDELLERVVPASKSIPAACLLDAGVNNGHRLLREGLTTDNLLACDPNWGVNDDRNHGTEMAGLCPLLSR